MALQVLSISKIFLSAASKILNVKHPNTSSESFINLVKQWQYSTTYARHIQTTSSQNSLTEFFDDPKNYGELSVKSGRAWRIDELRLKSNSDLHKLWFVLYKERNMLYTMQEDAKKEYESFPSPERIDKVEESMGNLENVVRERNDAYWKLEVSPCATGERQRAFRRDVFGRLRWHNCSQHHVPYRANYKFRNTQGVGKVDECDWFFKQYREMKRKHYNFHRSYKARYIRDLFRRFPDADVDYLEELHPEFPQGYIKHLKENLVLYDDPPRRSTNISVNRAAKTINASTSTSGLLQ